jgi:dolichyl-phosphate-mannose-protein mannosyltransferase
MVGLFTFFTIGTAVLVDMWDILDIRKRYPMVSTRDTPLK